MRDNQTIRLTSCLVDHNQVREVVSLADLDQVLQHVTTSVDSGRIGNDDFELFLESGQTLARVATCSDEQLGVLVLGILILVVDVRSCDHGVLVSKFQIMSHSISLLSELSWHSSVIVVSILHLNALVLSTLLFDFLGLCIEVVLPQSDVTSDHFSSFIY